MAYQNRHEYKARKDVAVYSLLQEQISNYDNMADVFSVAFDDDIPEGTQCQGWFVRGDKSTVPIEGNVDGKVASIVLPPNCYTVPGRFALTVKLVNGDVVTSVLVVEGSVRISRTDALAPAGDSPHSFDELVSAVENVESEMKRRDRVYNLLDNSYFLNPVNQRGQTSYTGSKYSIDRWRAFHDTTTHTITADGIAVSATDTSYNIYQPIDQTNFDPDKTYTAAVCDSDGNVFVWSGKPTTAISAPVCIYYNESNLLFRIVGAKTWAWAALYEGEYTAETLPPYIPKGYVAELQECQRYYRVINNYTNVLAHYMNATYIRGIVPEKNNMRIIGPTVTITSAEYYNAGTWVAITPSGAIFAGDSIIVSATVEAGTVGNAVMMRLAGNASADL